MNLLSCSLTTMLTLALIGGVFPSPLFSQTRFEIENDVVAPGGKDRWLTNKMELAIQDWKLGQEMYTPTDKRSEEIPVGDRPWDGYSYLGYEFDWVLGNHEVFTVEPRLGALGKASGTEWLQQWIHDDLGFGSHPSWAHVNESEPSLDVLITHKKVSYFESNVVD